MHFSFRVCETVLPLATFFSEHFLSAFSAYEDLLKPFPNRNPGVELSCALCFSCPSFLCSPMIYPPFPFRPSPTPAAEKATSWLWRGSAAPFLSPTRFTHLGGILFLLPEVCDPAREPFPSGPGEITSGFRWPDIFRTFRSSGMWDEPAVHLGGTSIGHEGAGFQFRVATPTSLFFSFFACYRVPHLKWPREPYRWRFHPVRACCAKILPRPGRVKASRAVSHFPFPLNFFRIRCLHLKVEGRSECQLQFVSESV